MSNKNTERLEQEARESLVAADLSAKMKQWRPAPETPKGGGRAWSIILLLSFLGAAWWFWPSAEVPPPQPTPQTNPAPTPDAPVPTAPEQPKPQPMAEKAKTNRYLALATSHYRAPNCASEVRGNVPDAKDPLDGPRRALAEKRPAEALKLLLSVPTGYETDANYLRAHALFALKKYTEAANLFGQLTSSMRYGEAAQWYGILAQLPSFEQHKTLITNRLTEIANDGGHSFQQEAKALQLAL